jgi:hypothetical protein
LKDLLSIWNKIYQLKLNSHGCHLQISKKKIWIPYYFLGTKYFFRFNLKFHVVLGNPKNNGTENSYLLYKCDDERAIFFRPHFCLGLHLAKRVRGVSMQFVSFFAALTNFSKHDDGEEGNRQQRGKISLIWGHQKVVNIYIISFIKKLALANLALGLCKKKTVNMMFWRLLRWKLRSWMHVERKGHLKIYLKQ